MKKQKITQREQALVELLLRSRDQANEVLKLLIVQDDKIIEPEGPGFCFAEMFLDILSVPQEEENEKEDMIFCRDFIYNLLGTVSIGDKNRALRIVRLLDNADWSKLKRDENWDDKAAKEFQKKYDAIYYDK